MTDRTLAPRTGSVDHVDFARAHCIELNNGIPVHVLQAGHDDVIRLDVVFSAGISFQNTLCIAAAVNALLQEGSQRYTASDLADHFDFYGAFLQNSCGIHDASYSLFSLNKHILSCIDLLADMLTTATFPEEETVIYQSAQKQRLQISLQKNSVLARQAFYQMLFGASHVLGRFAVPEDYDHITRPALVDFYQTHYLNKLPQVFVSGKVDERVLTQIYNRFERLRGNAPQQNTLIQCLQNTPSDRYFFKEKPGSLQAAIRIGKITITRNHPDYLGLQLANLILGGYFGSRLMKNIREDKGLTYGIYSSLEPYQGPGVFTIATEVNNKDHELAVAEIHREIKQMCEVPVPENELLKAKNYLLGSFMRNFDGAFAQMDRYKSLLDYRMGYDYYENYVQRVKNLTSEDIMRLSIKHLNPDSMITMVVGTNK